MSNVRCLGDGIADTCLALVCENLVIADVEVEVDSVKLTHKMSIFQKTVAFKNTFLERFGHGGCRRSRPNKKKSEECDEEMVFHFILNKNDWKKI